MEAVPHQIASLASNLIELNKYLNTTNKMLMETSLIKSVKLGEVEESEIMKTDVTIMRLMCWLRKKSIKLLDDGENKKKMGANKRKRCNSEGDVDREEGGSLKRVRHLSEDDLPFGNEVEEILRERPRPMTKEEKETEKFQSYIQYFKGKSINDTNFDEMKPCTLTPTFDILKSINENFNVENVRKVIRELEIFIQSPFKNWQAYGIGFLYHICKKK